MVTDGSLQPQARAAPPSLSAFHVLQSPAWKKISPSSASSIQEAEAVPTSPRLNLRIKTTVANSGASAESPFPSSPLSRDLLSPVERKKLLWEWATQGVGGKPVDVHEVIPHDDDQRTTVNNVEIKGAGGDADVQESIAETEHALMSDSSGDESSGTEEGDAASEEGLATIEPEGRSNQSADTASDAAVGIGQDSLAAALTPKKHGAEDMVTGEIDGEGGAFGSPLSVPPSSTHASPEKGGSGTDQSSPELTGSSLRGKGRARRGGEPGREDGGDTERIVRTVRKIWAQESEAEGGWEAERLRSLSNPARPVRSPNARHRTAAASSELPYGNGDEKLHESTPKAAENLVLIQNPRSKIEPDSDQHVAVASPGAEVQSPVPKVELEPAPQSGFSAPPPLPSDQPSEVPSSQVASPPVLTTQLSWEAQRLRGLRSPKASADKASSDEASADRASSDEASADKSSSDEAQPEAADQMSETSSDEFPVMMSAVTTAGSGESFVQEITTEVADVPELLIHGTATPSLAYSTSSLPVTVAAPLPLVADSAHAISEPRSIAHSHVSPEPPASSKASGETHEVAPAAPDHPSPTVGALAGGSPRKARKSWMVGPKGRGLARSNSLSDLPEDPTRGGGGESAGSMSLQGDAMEMKVARKGVVREREELERQWKEGREELDRAAQMARALKTAVESLAKAHGMRSESQWKASSSLATTSPAQSDARRTRTATSASAATSASTASASSLASSSQHSPSSGSRRHKRREGVLKSGGGGGPPRSRHVAGSGSNLGGPHAFPVGGLVTARWQRIRGGNVLPRPQPQVGDLQ